MLADWMSRLTAAGLGQSAIFTCRAHAITGSRASA
jgi:hypothetical protein